MGRRRKAAALLACAAVCLASIGPALTAATSDPIVTAAIPPASVPPHELRIERTQAGSEGLELAARLSETGNLIMRPVGWMVRRALAADPSGGETVLKQDASVADLRLDPGDYLVEATYGYVKVAHTVRVEPGRFVGLTLILNVGGIRALSKLSTLGMPAEVTASHRIYALNGRSGGHEIAAAAGQGELLRVPAGAYRIESRFSPGNAVANTEIVVKPGVLSSIEIAHVAGVARIDIPEASEDATWEVRASNGPWRASGKGDRPNLVLAPGSYVATAAVAGQSRSQAFTIDPGKTSRVHLSE